MSTYIKLCSGQYRKYVEPNGVEFDINSDNAYSLYCNNKPIVSHNGDTAIVSSIENEEEVVEILEEEGIEILGRRLVYWCEGPEGMVVHKIHEDPDTD